MHFIDRSSFSNPPLDKLAKIHIKEQPKWLAYKHWQNNGKPKPPRKAPSGKWRKAVFKELSELFLYNCGYCGISCGKKSSGEVDHNFPKELDIQANHIYDWDNFIWACHPCNNKKSSNYPLLDPCSKTDMDEIHFDDTNGKYLCYSKANQKIRDKYNNTIEWTFINDDENEKHLSNRLLIYSKLIDHLNNISRYSTRLMRFINLTGILQPKIDFHIEEIKKITTAGRYILLIKSIIDSSSIINQSSRQPYSFNDFI